MAARILYLIAVSGLLSGHAVLAGETPVVDPNLIGWWNFEEGSGAVALDASGYGHHGTLMGDPQWAPGYDGLALDLDGQGDYVETGKVPSELGIGGDAPRTVALWVYTRSFNGGGLYEMGGHVSAGNGFCLRTQTDDNGWRLVYGTWEFRFVADSLEEWVHIVHANDSRYAQVYVNGEQIIDTWRRLDTPDELTFRIGICRDLGFDGLIDDVRLYDRVVEQYEIARIMGGAASCAWDPCPAYGSHPTVDLAHSLCWSAGAGAARHDIYLGTDRVAVDTATTATEGVYQGRQPREATTFRLQEGPLQRGTTYYWRIDEIDSEGAVSKGGIWKFTVTDVLAGWWKFDDGAGDVALDSSGHAHHGTLTGDPAWVPGYDGLALDFDGLGDSVEIGKLPAELGIDVNVPWTIALWVYARSFDGGGVYEMGSDGEFDGLSLRTGEHDGQWLLRYVPDVRTFSVNSPDEWVHMVCVRRPYWADVLVNGQQVQTDYSQSDSVDEAPLRVGVVDHHYFDGLIDDIRLYGRAVTQDEVVQIMQGDPARAWAPQPGHDSALTLDETGVLCWSAGTDAVAHDIYFGTDRAAVRDATTETEGIYRGRQRLDATVYVPPEAPLEWKTTYYWRVDEVGDDGTVARGGLWRFTTLDYLIVDDFESYDDEKNRIYEAWRDGWYNGTGSIVGYLESPFVEIVIARSGRQSMPFSYDNTVSPWYSEASHLWEEPQDWTRFGVDTLTLYFVGHPIAFLERDDGTIIMGGGRTYSANDEDGVSFARRSLDGDGSIVVRVADVAGTGPQAQAGVMIRGSLDGKGQNAAVTVSAGNEAAFWHRRDEEGSTERVTRSGLQVPYWVRLTREGDMVTVSCSADGVEWVGIADNAAASSVEMALDEKVYIGLAVTGGLYGGATSAVFSDISLTGNVTDSWEVARIGGKYPYVGNDPDSLYVAVADENGNLAVVNHPDLLVVGVPTWECWDLPLKEFAAAGVDVTRITQMFIGVGDRDHPTPSGEGMIHFDDFRLTRSNVAAEPNAVP